MKRMVRFIVFVSLSFIILYYSLNPLFAPISPDFEFQDIIASLGGMFIIVLLVERATEIIVSIFRDSEYEQKKQNISDLGKDSSQTDELVKARRELLTYKNRTKEVALLISFSLSTIVCAAGVGLLGEVIDIPGGNESFIRGVDILLTSGLIAGGSDAFHQFVRAFEVFFTKTKENIENSSRQSEV